jgi:hypothetical protein
MYFVYRNKDEKPYERDLFGVGAHLGIMPVLWDDGTWIIPQFCIGPEIRVDQSWDSHTDKARSHFVIPLVFELNLLAAGD